MKFQKGQVANPKGRPPGIPNVLKRDVKEALLSVFEQRGGAKGVADWADENPNEFYKACVKLIPAETVLAGDINITIREFKQDGHRDWNP